MTTKNLLNQEDKKILSEENETHGANFQQFHKKIFDEMLDQAMFLACKILDRNGKRPGVGNFENEFNYLTTHIMGEKIKLLGTYLK